MTAAEGLERHLDSKYPGTKRFGLEGGESFIPLIDATIRRTGSYGAKEMVLGMAHRGRLNTLVNVLGKNPADLFDEFEGKRLVDTSGDVKYHQGFSSNVMTPGGEMHLALAFNPSHLEIVSPVVEGSVRARQDRRDDTVGNHVVPVVIHGDASFAGQGVVMETFQMSQTRAYKTGGTIHIVINNQVGFTTNKQEDARSTDYCTDVAKMIETTSRTIYADKLVAEGVVSQEEADELARGYRDMLDRGESVARGRGTFSHRHAVVHNQKDGSAYVPLEHVKEGQPPFEIYDSLLSEEAVLAFEYGYATTTPNGLVIWEAQFGDFANGAQVVIDQFITSGEHKWGRLCGLTLLLPHGYEGQGPEHSSARLERFMQLCAEHNIQVCIPTTPAQVFHMIRRQAIRPMRRPLVVMSPKWILRHKLATSSIEELAEGSFQPVIGDSSLEAEEVKRVVLCSGKVYYHLLEAREEREQTDVALVRIEQLYPFPEDCFGC